MVFGNNTASDISRYFKNFEISQDGIIAKYHVQGGRHGGSVVSASNLGPEFKPWPVHPRCVLRQITQVSQCLSPPRCINGNQEIAWGQPDKMLGGNLQWTSIPSRGSRTTPSGFILQKLLALMSLLACPIMIAADFTYLFITEANKFLVTYKRPLFCLVRKTNADVCIHNNLFTSKHSATS